MDGLYRNVCKESTKTQIILCDPAKVQVWQKELEKGGSKEEAVRDCKRRFVNAGIITSTISMQKRVVTENNDLQPLRDIAPDAENLNGCNCPIHPNQPSAHKIRRQP